MSLRRPTTALLAAAALAVPLAGCGEDDVEREVGQARDEIQQKVKELEGNLDDLSKQDLREALRDVERSAKNGGKDAKREARELERKIERELNER